jgi:hypothetical protein
MAEFEPWKEEAEPEAPAPEPVVEAAPEPAPTPEVKAEAPPAAAPEPERKTYNESVPYDRFREVLGRQREAEAKYQEAMEKLKALEQPKAPEVKIPAYEEDPVEHLRIKTQLQEQQVAEVRERLAQDERFRQAESQRQQFLAWYTTQAEDYAKQQSDFRAAYDHAMGRMRELITPAAANPQAVAQTLEQWEAAVVSRAAQEGRNPAEAIYALAKTLGYAPPAPAAPSAADKVVSIEEGRERGKSLGPSRSAAEPEEEDDDMGGLKTLFEAQSEMGLRRRK